MIFDIPTFTLIHTLISLVSIVAGLVAPRFRDGIS